MSRHRVSRQRTPAGRRRAEPVHPRWGRIGVLGASLLTTGVALLGGVGVLPSAADESPRATTVARDTGPAVAAGPDVPTVTLAPATEARQAPPTRQTTQKRELKPRQQPAGGSLDVALPGDSGEGRRVVFSEGRQRVWLVDDDGTVQRTYLVSGSVEDNLDPGTYDVYSRSADAIGIDGSSMRLFVRFTRGPSGAAIGFHDIPTDPDNGDAQVQTAAELGTPRSHGCIRQKAVDAAAMWRFADDGTTVVVTA